MDAKVVTKAARKAAKTPFGYALPQLSPLYTAPPYEYRDAWAMMIPFRSDPRVVARYVPKPLVPDPAGHMFVTISRFFTSGFGHYNEIILCALAKLQGRPVNFSLYLILDNDIAIGAGREIWGFPKKSGRVELCDRDGVLTGSVERGGLTLVRGAMQIGELSDPGAVKGSAEYVNLKLVPSVKNGAAPEIMQLTSTTLGNLQLKQVYKGRATLEFGASPADRLHEIPVQEVMDAYYYNADFTLGDGEVVHDFLRAQKLQSTGGR